MLPKAMAIEEKRPMRSPCEVQETESETPVKSFEEMMADIAPKGGLKSTPEAMKKANAASLCRALRCHKEVASVPY
jgi:hypothetical protein